MKKSKESVWIKFTHSLLMSKLIFCFNLPVFFLYLSKQITIHQLNNSISNRTKQWTRIFKGSNSSISFSNRKTKISLINNKKRMNGFRIIITVFWKINFRHVQMGLARLSAKKSTRFNQLSSLHNKYHRKWHHHYMGYSNVLLLRRSPCNRFQVDTLRISNSSSSISF